MVMMITSGREDGPGDRAEPPVSCASGRAGCRRRHSCGIAAAAERDDRDRRRDPESREGDAERGEDHAQTASDKTLRTASTVRGSARPSS